MLTSFFFSSGISRVSEIRFLSRLRDFTISESGLLLLFRKLFSESVVLQLYEKSAKEDNANKVLIVVFFIVYFTEVPQILSVLNYNMSGSSYLIALKLIGICRCLGKN